MIKKRVLLIGSNGLLGQRAVEILKNKKGIEFLASSIEDKSFIDNVEYLQSDITNKKSVKKLFKEFYPDFIINCAAYTAVDKCETNKEIAYSVNVTGVENLADQSRWVNGHLIHVSTDYIFDGENGPYHEDDLPSPVNYYGKSKLAGENVIRAFEIPYTILRTNVIYGIAKNEFFDFVKWVYNSLKENKQINIVTDQINNPTYTDDLVSVFNTVINDKVEGIFNVGGQELLSRYDFTIRIADFFNLDKSLIKPISTAELNLPATRPLKSGLINIKAETELEYKPTSIEKSFEKIAQESGF